MMKLYSFCTPSHVILKEKWFVPSLKDDYELVLRSFSQVGGIEQQYGTFEFNKTMLLKVELIIKAIEENWGNIFLYSDVDVQFFKPTKDIILKAIKGKDMVVHLDACAGILCPGFFAAMGNEKNLKLWQCIKTQLIKQYNRHDQDILNELLLDNASRFSVKVEKIFNLSKDFIDGFRANFNQKKYGIYLGKVFRSNPFGIKWGYLPIEFFSPGIFLGKTWEPGMDFEVPKNIVLHHVNWTIGINNKLAQMEYVKNIVNKREHAAK